MFIQDYKDVLPYVLDSGMAVLLHGHHGIGKSQATRDFAKEHGHFYADVRLGNMADTGDLVGLPEILRNAEGKAESFDFMVPQWLKEVSDFAKANPDKRSIIFLDELNRARRDVLQAIFQLVLDKQLGNYKLPDNVGVIAAVNPGTDDYVTTDLTDQALQDRFCHFKLMPSKEEWFGYASKVGVSNDIVNFLRENPNMLESELEDFSLSVTPSRRTWITLNKIYAKNPPQHLFRLIATGMVGLEATQGLLTYAENQEKPLNAEDIINSYPTHRKTLKKWIKGNELALIQRTCDNLVTANNNLDKKEFFVDKDGTVWDLEDSPGKEGQKQMGREWMKDTEAKNILAFLLDLPAESFFTTCQRIFTTVPSFMMMQASDKLIKRLESVKKANPEVNKQFLAEYEAEQAEQKAKEEAKA